MNQKGLFRLFALMLTIATTATWVSAAESNFSLPKQLPVQILADKNTILNGVPIKAVILDPTPSLAPRKVPAQVNLATAAQTATSSFEITYIANGGSDLWGEPCYTFPEEAKAAFNAAADIWANILVSDVPITIKACWATLDSASILGYAGGQPEEYDFLGATRSNTVYVGALANALAGSDLSPDPDMHITYNSSFDWYYGTDGNTPSDQVDLVTVVLHEIAHGLNFSGSMNYSSGNGSWGYGVSYPNIFDVFIRDGSANQLIETSSYSNPSTALGTALTSDNLWFHGTKAMEANGGQPVKIYAPSSWAPGSSYAHLDYTTFNNTVNQLMIYAVSQGESVHDPGAVTRGLLQDLGWPTATSSSSIPSIVPLLLPLLLSEPITF